MKEKTIQILKKGLLIIVGMFAVIIISAWILSSPKTQLVSTTKISIVAEPKPQLKAELVDCSYQSFPNRHEWDRFWFFFKITNIGDTPTRTSAHVYFVPEKSISKQTSGSTVSGKIFEHIYGKNEVLGGEIQWASGNKGEEWYWEIYPRRDFSYKLVYCEGSCSGFPINETFDFRDGLVAYGLVIYEGNTNTCKTTA